MPPPIQPLPTEVVHLMVAGEVIDSLAAVVRELVENALDAGATRITIALWPEQWQVRVADNGIGMGLADLQQAARPHSTSKIREADDLWQIRSLGFRGEALHSLAQLAQVRICSRPAGEDMEGWQVLYNPQGQPEQMETVAIAPGTVVTVTDLFGIWPARRQALPGPTRQLRSVQTVVQQLALCHPSVTWQVEQQDRPWFSIWPGASSREILPQFLREVQGSDLQEVTLTLPDGTVQALVGLPDRCHRHRPDWVRVAVNGRCVRFPELEQTILTAFRRTLPRDRFPVCLVQLQVPADQVDWNRHPAKAEVYLQNLDDWQAQVTEAIGQALRLNSTALSETFHLERVSQLLKTAEAQGEYGVSRSLQPSSDDPLDLTPTPEPPPLQNLRAVAQVHQMYILVEHSSGMWLVEQHIAHERVLYEQLIDRWQMVSLASPIVLANLTDRQIEQLQRLGLEVEPFGDRLWAVRTVPECLADREDCQDALMELSLGGDLQSALVATACRTAIRNGTALTLPEMQTLLDQWQRTRNPRTCPHGRPIYLSLAESSLARFFRRHWVIGKSHGI
ncbi:MAG: DNA mismatch repair endonuclease MutL [Leptolyngbyaceae cyanobacterium bins.59]|nr:DNA mismatch repair endonuclease MutL [Leptolyngbyaceae cyanobacterium bins.59]